MEPFWRIPVCRCSNSVNSLLEVLCWKVSYLFILISRLLADPSHTALLWGCLGVSLYHWESTHPFLFSIIRGRESLTSVWCSEGLTWVPLIGVCPCCIQLLNRWGWAKPPAPDSGLGRLGSQSCLHSLNCHQNFGIGGWPSVVTCPLTAGLRPLESSAKLPWIDDLQT